MEDRIWLLMSQMKFNEEYLCKLIKHYKYIIWWYNLTIAFFSACGVIAWIQWKIAPFISCVIITIFSLLKSLKSNLIPSEELISEYNHISSDYGLLFNKSETLYRNILNSNFDDTTAQKKLNKIESEKRKIDMKTNQHYRRGPKRLINNAQKECDQFFISSF